MDITESQRYEILDDDYGKGGFGQISKQKDCFLERLVAVKRLNLLADEESRERFVREAKTLARMSHPNVPAIYDVKFHDDEMTIYFEFIEGDNLRKVIESGRIPSLPQAVKWFTQIASALQHSSDLGIIHRDVKPENIIISQNGTAAYLVDFGIALTSDDVKRITEKGYVIGTIAYMSPEQREGKELDGRSDVYSLGLTLYETLRGHLPVAGRYDALSDANEAIPPSIDDLIKSCLVVDKERRLGSASDFERKLIGAFRTDVPLSQLLTDARLDELYSALRTMSPEEFSAKPKGQKLLILNRMKDLVRSDNRQIQKPTADVIALLVNLYIEEHSEQYEIIVTAAYEWGYEKLYGVSWQGDDDIRKSLIDASKVASTQSHKVLARSIIEFIKRTGVEGKDGWYYHDLRANLISLLANPHSAGYEEELADLYDEVNRISH